MDRPPKRTVTTRRSLKRKLEEDFVEDNQENEPDRKSPAVEPQDPLREIRALVKVLESTVSSFEADRAAAKVAARALVELAKNGNHRQFYNFYLSRAFLELSFSVSL